MSRSHNPPPGGDHHDHPAPRDADRRLRTARTHHRQLKRQGRPFLIVDSHARVGDQWRQQWDTLRLYTSAKYDGLPGMPFPADSWSFPHKDEVADHLESYASRWELPVRLSTRIDALETRAGGGYVATLGDETFTCDNVVVATDPFGRTPHVPELAEDLDPLHPPAALQRLPPPEPAAPGTGAGRRGVPLWHRHRLRGRPHPRHVLCGRDCGQVPWRIDERVNRVGFPALLFVFKHVLTRRTPMGRKELPEARRHGGRCCASNAPTSPTGAWSG